MKVIVGVPKRSAALQLLAPTDRTALHLNANTHKLEFVSMKKSLAWSTVSALLIGLALGAHNSRVSAANGTVEAIDCSNSLGLVQMFFNASTRTATAKQLVFDEDAGSSDASNNYTEFSPAWTISLDVPGDDDLKALNGTSINPLDGKAYGTARSDASVEYLVRFDRDGDLEFLHTYSATTINNGAFDSSGRFYSAATVDGSKIVQRWDNLHQSTGSTDPSSDAVTYRPADASGPLVTNGPADVALIEVGGIEYIIGVPNSTTNALMVFNTETLTSTSFDASSSVTRSGATGLPSGSGYGAAWTFEGTAYLSQNNGQGLWSITADDIDINAETATLRQVLQATQASQSNDGFGCPSESLTEDSNLPGSAGVAHLRYHANGGTGDDYSPSDAYVMPGDGETDHLYALWQEVPATTTTSTTTVAPTTVAPTTTDAPTTTIAPAATIVLPSTGSSDGTVTQVLLVLGIGGLLVLFTRRQLDVHNQ